MRLAQEPLGEVKMRKMRKNRKMPTQKGNVEPTGFWKAGFMKFKGEITVDP